jgi:iron complex transport system substrate-binding protein
MRKPLRILSLAPTQTEVLAALGLTEELVGVTQDCDYPEEIRQVHTFGGWWEPDVARIRAAAPDLVCTFGQRQEDLAGFLSATGLKVFHSDPGTVSAALDDIRELGTITGTDAVATGLCKSLRKRIWRVQQRVTASRRHVRPRVLRIMHWQPLVSVGPGAFQHDVIVLAGGQNVTADGPAPYFTFDPAEICRRDPEVIFCCEPHILDHLRVNPVWQAVSAVRHNRLHVFDCGLTCRSGPRIVDMLESLANVLHNRKENHDAFGCATLPPDSNGGHTLLQ